MCVCVCVCVCVRACVRLTREPWPFWWWSAHGMLQVYLVSAHCRCLLKVVSGDEKLVEDVINDTQVPWAPAYRRCILNRDQRCGELGPRCTWSVVILSIGRGSSSTCCAYTRVTASCPIHAICHGFTLTRRYPSLLTKPAICSRLWRCLSVDRRCRL